MKNASGIHETWRKTWKMHGEGEKFQEIAGQLKTNESRRKHVGKSSGKRRRQGKQVAKKKLEITSGKMTIQSWKMITFQQIWLQWSRRLWREDIAQSPYSHITWPNDVYPIRSRFQNIGSQTHGSMAMHPKFRKAMCVSGSSANTCYINAKPSEV